MICNTAHTGKPNHLGVVSQENNSPDHVYGSKLKATEDDQSIYQNEDHIA